MVPTTMGFAGVVVPILSFEFGRAPETRRRSLTMGAETRNGKETFFIVSAVTDYENTSQPHHSFVVYYLSVGYCFLFGDSTFP
jgi:hypothetical protein